MSRFSVLRADVDTDAGKWTSLWERAGHSPFAHPAYVSLQAQPDDRAVCAAWEDGNQVVLLPLLVRPVPVDPQGSSPERTGETWWDAISPYGYGGPFRSGPDPAPEGFWRELEGWLGESGIVSVFLRFSLSASGLEGFPGTVVDDRPNLVRDLTADPSEIWMDYEHKVRKNVKKARRAGVRILADKACARVPDFYTVYQDTLQRRNASERGVFSEAWISRLVSALPGNCAMFHAEHEGRIVSTELVLLDDACIYSFLGGTLAHAFDARPNDLLKHAVVEWGHEQGKTAYVLGGGYERKDGIYRYKLSFAPNGEVEFRTGQWIVDPGTYEELVRQRQKALGGRSPDRRSRKGFFPAYRRH